MTTETTPPGTTESVPYTFNSLLKALWDASQAIDGIDMELEVLEGILPEPVLVSLSRITGSYWTRIEAIHQELHANGVPVHPEYCPDEDPNGEYPL